MKKSLLLMIIIFNNISIFSQENEYSIGFRVGYKNGYCYNDFGCIAPIPPIAPIPLIGERFDNYQDGYNRGFKKGLEDKQLGEAKTQKNTEVNINRTQPLNNGIKIGGGPEIISDTHTGTGIKLRPIDNNLYKNPHSNYESRLRNEENRINRAIAEMNQVKDLYNSYMKYPEKIENGWYNVFAGNNYSSNMYLKAFVENNKVTRLVQDEWIEIEILFSTYIINAKTTAKLKYETIEMGLYDIYFIEYIDNPTVYTAPPVGAGKVSFWINGKTGGNTKLYVDEMFEGTFDAYFDNGKPYCGQKGTITVSKKPGIYSFRAVSSGTRSNKVWEGEVIIRAGECTLQGLTVK